MIYNPKKEPIVTIIIPAYNESKYIRKSIESIKLCGYPLEKIEIIVVDNGSEDDTRKIASENGATVLVDESCTVAGLRNLGAKDAKGEILAFLDADCTVSKNWICAANKALENDSAAIAGARLKAPTCGTWFEKTWAKHLLSSSGDDGYVKYVNSGNMFIKKKIFMKIGGFSEQLESNEDVDICEKASRLGYAILHYSDIEAIHWGYPKDFITFIKREIWHGRGDTVRNYSRIWRSKPLILSVFNCLCLAMAMFCFFQSANALGLGSLMLMILPPILLSLKTTKKLGRYEKIGQLICVYSAYSIARTIAFLQISIQKITHFVKKYYFYFFGSNYTPIIVYHRLCEQSDKKYSITSDEFTQHLEFLKFHKYSTLTMDEYIDALNHKNTADMSRCILITFDDGHASDFDIAMPLLHRYGFKATFFITSDWIEKPGYMTGDQLNELKNRGMSIQSHAKSHSYLNEKGVDIDQELNESKTRLERITGKMVRFLSFPGGRYNRKVLQAAKKAGYSAVCSSVPFYISRGDCLVIGRSMIRYRGQDTNFLKIMNAGPLRKNNMRLSYAIKLALKRILGNEFYRILWSYYNKR